VHFIVKTEDDLRQEAFAMQLLFEFNEIFQMEDLPIKVVPSEVVPLGQNYGLIEYLKDTLTIDEIRKRESNLQFIKQDPIKL
jgi:phosphatidylinositol 4-kinase